MKPLYVAVFTLAIFAQILPIFALYKMIESIHGQFTGQMFIVFTTIFTTLLMCYIYKRVAV